MDRRCIGVDVRVAFAHSQQPPPSAPESKGDPPKSEGGRPQPKTQPDDRGTEKAPAIVKVLPAPKSEAEAAQDAKEKEEKAATDRWLVGLTGVLAVVGFLQLLVFGGQAFLFYRQLKTMRDTVNQGKITADAAQASAETTKMQMRAWVFIGPKLATINSGAPGKVSFQMIIGAYGETPGRVTEYCVQTSPDCPTGEPHYDEAFITRAEFPMGQDDQFPIQSVFTVGVHTFVFGYVKYVDAFKAPHCSRFCGKVNGSEPKYVVAGGPRWNEFD